MDTLYNVQTLTAVSFEISSSVTLHRTILNARSASVNKDGQSVAQCSALRILLYPQKCVFFLTWDLIFNK